MRDIRRSPLAMLLLGTALVAPPIRAQAPGQPGVPGATHENHAEHPAAPAAEGSPAMAGPSLSLSEIEALALQNNPTLAQAAAGVRRAQGLTRQAGAYPNPVLGVTGDDNTPNQVYRGGEVGVFGEQRIVTAGKLRLSRDVYSQQEARARAAEEAQRYRVLTAVRALFYQALGAQRLVEVQGRLLAAAREAVAISRELVNVGQADQPDLLQSEIESQQSELALARAEIEQQRVWRQLAAVAGNPALEMTPLEGDLEAFPALRKDAALQKILQESPEVKMAAAGVAQATASLEREKVEKIPDILARGGFRYHPFLGQDLRPVGLAGFFDVGIEIPLFDRNKGGIQAARGHLEQAEHEVGRVELSLRSRLAAVYQEYEVSARLAEKYRQEMLPRAQQAYDLYRNSFQQMAAAYPQVLIAQRNLFQLQRDYVYELVNVWRSAVEVEGMLLNGGLEPPLESTAFGTSEALLQMKRLGMEPQMNTDEH